MNLLLRTILPAAGAMILWSASAAANSAAWDVPLLLQEESKPAGSKAIDAKTKNAKAKPAGEAVAAQEPAGDTQATGKNKRGRDGKTAQQARAHKEVLKPVAAEEARYRKRIAQLDEIGQIASKKNNEEQTAQVEELRVQNDEHHAARLTELRLQHGDEKVDAALAFIETHGKGRPIQPPKNKKAREKAKEQTGRKTGEKVKEGKEDMDKAKEKAKEKSGEKPQGV
jgi:hypothetical protein